MAALSLQRFSHVAQLSLGTEAGRSLIETVEAKPNWKAVGYSIIVKRTRIETRLRGGNTWPFFIQNPQLIILRVFYALRRSQHGTKT